MRLALGLKPGQSGMRVRSIEPASAASQARHHQGGAKLNITIITSVYASKPSSFVFGRKTLNFSLKSGV